MITQDIASSICRNRNDYRVKLVLYNGETVDCIPTFYKWNEDKLEVTTIPERQNISVKRMIIDNIEELTPGFNQAQLDYQSNSFSGEFAKKMIIIGAGASCGYSHTLRDKRKAITPPLANAIFSPQFDTFLDLYPGAKNLSASSFHSQDIEAFFQKHWNRLSSYDVYDPATIHSLINTQYYLSAIFLKISQVQKGNRYNHYQELVQLINEYLSNKASQEKVLIVSFNYDLLLEEALESFLRYSFKNIDEYVDYKSRSILLFKPHGSCNWFRKTDLVGYSSYTDIQMALKHASSDLFHQGSNLGQIKESLANQTEIMEYFPGGFSEFQHFPQLLIPYKDKDEFAMPLKHTEILEFLMSKIEDILIIGWKGSEEKFKELIKRTLGDKKINIHCANKGDNTINSDYQKLLPSANIQSVETLLENVDPTKWKTKSADFGNLIKYITTERNFFFE